MAKKKGKPAEIEEEIEYVSRTELKREAQEFHQLGSEIAKMGKKQRERLPLNDDLKEAMVVADKISNKSDVWWSFSILVNSNNCWDFNIRKYNENTITWSSRWRKRNSI